MKIGDLVKWVGTADLNAARPDTGIVVEGPRRVHSTSRPGWRSTYAIAWFDAKETFWHEESSVEVISENR